MRAIASTLSVETLTCQEPRRCCRLGLFDRYPGRSSVAIAFESLERIPPDCLPRPFLIESLNSIAGHHHNGHLRHAPLLKGASTSDPLGIRYP